ncbi:hypothetical protein DFQ27_002840 [Actinomortierella ambigua]|uniref:Uncharacterized protein n=1 Tax=Actinomortierella ambigua TaxID=1343610 RepID=A0A9P6QKR3_9FUNG|nr:hypothetical protein DFQ27_002840 [Actinomortierella ambigua]
MFTLKAYFGEYAYIDESLCSHTPAQAKRVVHVNLYNETARREKGKPYDAKSVMQNFGFGGHGVTGWQVIADTNILEIGLAKETPYINMVGFDIHQGLNTFKTIHPAPNDADVLRLRAIHLPADISSDNIADGLRQSAGAFGNVISVALYGLISTASAASLQGRDRPFFHEGKADIFIQTGFTSNLDGKGKVALIPEATTLAIDIQGYQIVVPIEWDRVNDLCSRSRS